MIVDSHSHAWRRWPYTPSVPDPESRGTVEQLLFAMDESGVDQAVVICARIGGNDDNVEYVQAAAARFPGRLHCFPDFDCEWSPTYHRPGAADRLRQLLDLGPISGVTHYQRPENDGWLRSREARELFAVAADRDLLISITAHAGWHADLRRIARQFPTVPILCHHLASIADGAQLEDVLASAPIPNILIKLSGFYYGAPGYVLPRSWDFPYPGSLAVEVARRLYEEFGPRRLCWGSDYPVCSDSITYRQALELVRTHCDFVRGADRPLILGDTLAAILATRRPLD